jgi:hypothetical protein
MDINIKAYNFPESIQVLVPLDSQHQRLDRTIHLPLINASKIPKKVKPPQ